MADIDDRYRCTRPDCRKDGHEVYDTQGLYAGRFCDEHEKTAPGQWDYYDAGDCEPLYEDG